jgi:hypothetical protein
MQSKVDEVPPYTGGGAGTVRVKTDMMPKIDDRGRLCMFIGYTDDHKEDVYVKLPQPPVAHAHRHTDRTTRLESHSGQSSPITCVCYYIPEQDYKYLINLVMTYLLHSIFY